MIHPGFGAQGFQIPAIAVPERSHTRRTVLIWQVHGSTVCTIEGEPRRLIAGFALWLPTRLRHTLHIEPNSIAIPLMFTLRPPPGELRLPTWIAIDTNLRLLLLALLQAQTSILQAAVDLEAEVLRALPGRAVTSPALPLPGSTEARAIALHLQLHPEDTRTVAELAAAHHVSTRTIERAFLRDTGLSLHAWRTRFRMEIAGALLRAATPIEVVAHKTGYQSLSAFRRAFTRHYEATPSEYARGASAG